MSSTASDNREQDTIKVVDALQNRIGRGDVANEMVLVGTSDDVRTLSSHTLSRHYTGEEVKWTWDLDPYMDTNLPAEHQPRSVKTVVGFQFKPNQILVGDEHVEAVRKVHEDDDPKIKPTIHSFSEEAEGYARWIVEKA